MNRAKIEAIAPDMMSDRVVFIACGSENIGMETVRLFKKAGAAVAVNSCLECASAFEAELAGTKHLVLANDLTDEKQVDETCKKGNDELGAVNILVVISNYSERGAIEDITCQMWDQMLIRQLRPAFLCAKAASAQMKAAKYGKIVLVSSASAKVGGRVLDVGVHAAAAANAMIGLARGRAMELAPFSINVNSICPGAVSQEMDKSHTPEQIAALRESYPAQNFIDAVDVAGGILFLASDYSGWMAGYSMDMNDGLYMG